MNLNTTVHAFRGRGVKDTFTAKTIGKQDKNDKGVVEDRTLDYSGVTSEQTDVILSELTKLENYHVLLAKAYDLHQVEKAKLLSNPVGIIFTMLMDRKLFTDEDKARQKAQALEVTSRAMDWTHEFTVDMFAKSVKSEG